MITDATVLIVDDDQDILTAGKLLLKRHFSHIILCNTPEQIPTLMGDHQFDAILLDMNFSPGQSSGAQGRHWLKKMLELDPQSVVVMITAHGGIDVAVEAMKLGATDFVSKPWQNEKLIATMTTAVRLGQSRHEASALRNTNKALIEERNKTNQLPVTSRSPAMHYVQSLIERTAPTDANVLVLGENGTGKELAASALHRLSLRAHAVFMSVDLGAVSETLFESELFGHKKGAFTGASEERTGKLEAANGGTLFLDEIGNLPLHLQAKLLTVLEQRQVTPLGANKPIPLDIRVIAATNLAKQTLNDDARFRQDLLFRLNTVEIELPPLRERPEDVVPIAHHFMQLYSKKYSKPVKTINPDANTQLSQYAWPGNIRALRHAIERAVILSTSEQLELDDFQLGINKPETTPTPCDHSNSTIADSTQLHEVNDFNLEKIEKSTIATALKKHRYNISHTAKALGLTRAALYRRMEKYGL